jgi:aspartyl-tRNA(Asn)/glutamyl-tRNA(Gln) amidotransferase subunit B
MEAGRFHQERSRSGSEPMQDKVKAAGKNLVSGATGDWGSSSAWRCTHRSPPSKLFSGASTEFGAAPNKRRAGRCRDAGHAAVINGNAGPSAPASASSRINLKSVFDRKNYFYPDLPQGYQISQYKQPIVGEGEVEIDVDGETIHVGIERLHLEQDAGKSIHDQHPMMSLVDLNRAGVR